MRIDSRVRAALQGFTANYYVNRAKSFQECDFEKLREQFAQVRGRALERNSELLDQFQKNAEAHGSRVLRARDGDEANNMILDIMKKHGAKKLFKSKSMVSEETRLNEFLLAHGIEPRETDLGEWIVQLRSERPTHMVLPAIHLTRREVAEVFSARLGREVPSELASLVQVAREELRREIFEAEAGLTGANALVAENGAMMMITNEGNGRLVSTVPPVHIVLTSIEKVLPTMNDALLMLRLLPRSATGQTITSYVSFLAGPHRQSQYIILLDNHRSELLAEPVFRQVLRCVKCSACLNFCPVYLLLGGAGYAHIYMGGIGTLLTAWLHGLRESREMANLCLGCHRCEQVCPAKIKIADLVIDLRQRLNQELDKPALKSIAFDVLISEPQRLERIFAVSHSTALISRSRDGFARKLPRPFRRYDHFRSLPGPSAKSFSRVFGEEFSAAGQKGDRGMLKIYAGCLVEHFYPETGIASAKVLRKLGWQVEIIEAGCCGFPAAASGFSDAAKKAFARLMENAAGDESIITFCPTCTTMLTHLGPKLLPGGEAEALAKRVFPFSRFIFEREHEALKQLLEGRKLDGKTTWHDSCHQKYMLQAGEASRGLLKMLAGGDFVELPGADSCCGFAGTFSLDHPEISEALLAEKLEAIRKSGAQTVAVDCPGCLLQIRGGCHRQKLKVRVRHIAELAAELCAEKD